MQADTLVKVKDLIRTRTGIIIQAEKEGDLAAIVEKRLRELRVGEADYPTYLASIPDEAVALVSPFTVQETSFYRYRQHFDRLKLEVLPELIRRQEREKNRRLLIVSAGCATGEEPYTIAMIVHDLLKEREQWEARIVATDINARALAQAREGCYSGYRLRNIDPWYVYRYFETSEHGGAAAPHRIKRFVQDMVEFRQANLARAPFPLSDLAGANVVFCENVIIYFSMEAIQRLIDELYGLLAPGGFLFLGSSETLSIVSHRFELTWWNESFAYRKPLREPQAAASVPPAAAPVQPLEPAEFEAVDLPIPQLMYLILQSFESESYDTAANLLRQAERSGQPLTDVYHVVKAEYLYEHRQYIPAANECRQAISLNPKAAAAHLLLGVIYLDLGMHDNAHFEIKTALYHQPESTLGYYYLAQYYAQTGEVTERDYCLAFAKHLLDGQGNILSGRFFPLYRTRRTAIVEEIRRAGPLPSPAGRSAAAIEQGA